jgi:dephospho-CoA kinase
MLKVGLTGGLASGKTFVGCVLEELGCYLIQADQLGHEVIAPGGESYAAMVREFGSGILDQSGQIDRRALAAQVFPDPQRLAVLNRMVHPPVLKREAELLAAFAARQPDGVAVVEAAILIETGSYQRFDRIILVTCDLELQVKRAVKRDGLSEAEVRARLERQMPLAEKRKFAHFVIDTSGEKEQTVEQTRAVYQALRRIDT